MDNSCRGALVTNTSDENEPSSSVCNPYDMNSTDFNSDLYMNKLLKESRLSELMDTEQMLYKQIQTLDSEMQTLIYENYNKFISATETVKKMSSHFNKMEVELDALSTNMLAITNKSSQVTKNISGRRDELCQLTSTHLLLNKLQFILELPIKMNELIQEKKFEQAVEDYLCAKKTLDLYANFPSIKNIQIECNEMLDKIKETFYDQLSNENSSTHDSNQAIHYLIKLNENEHKLGEKYLEMCEKKLLSFLSSMKLHLSVDEVSHPPAMDILEFIDSACNNYLKTLNETVLFHSENFVNQETESLQVNLVKFVDKRMEDLFGLILERIQLETTKQPNNIIMFVRALDRFYKTIIKLSKLFTFSNYNETGLDIVYQASRSQCQVLLEMLVNKFKEEMTTVRADLNNEISKYNSMIRSKMQPPQINSNSPLSSTKNVLSETLISVETRISEDLKQTLSTLSPFFDAELRFVTREFKTKFIRECVHKNIVLEYIKFILLTSLEYEASYSTQHVPSQLILILSKLCLDMGNSIINYLFNCTEELFKLKHDPEQANQLAREARDTSHRLLNVYVWMEGQFISNMIRKSVETRDWLSNVEPRSVRSVMRRLIEDIATIDYYAGQLYEEGLRVERASSDSSRTYSYSNNRQNRSRTNWSYSTKYAILISQPINDCLMITLAFLALAQHSTTTSYRTLKNCSTTKLKYSLKWNFLNCPY